VKVVENRVHLDVQRVGRALPHTSRQPRTCLRAGEHALAGSGHPLAAVNKLAGRVEVAGVTGCLGDDVQDDRAEIGQPPVGPDLGRP
jgi:hypothetical protein